MKHFKVPAERKGSMTTIMTKRWSLLVIQLAKESLQTAFIWMAFDVINCRKRHAESYRHQRLP